MDSRIPLLKTRGTPQILQSVCIWQTVYSMKYLCGSYWVVECILLDCIYEWKLQNKGRNENLWYCDHNICIFGRYLLDVLWCSVWYSRKLISYIFYGKTWIWVNMGSGNGLLLDSTKPLPELMLTYHWRYLVAFTWEQFHKKGSLTSSVACVRKLHFWNYYHISQGPMS